MNRKKSPKRRSLRKAIFEAGRMGEMNSTAFRFFSDLEVHMEPNYKIIHKTAVDFVRNVLAENTKVFIGQEKLLKRMETESF